MISSTALMFCTPKSVLWDRSSSEGGGGGEEEAEYDIVEEEVQDDVFLSPRRWEMLWEEEKEEKE